MGETKIFVVVLLLVIIFMGIASFLLFLERRIATAERKLKQLEEQTTKTTEDQ